MLDSFNRPWRTPRAAYVHLPFCRHKCGYCDFAVAAGQDHLIPLYVEALSAELATLGEPRPVDTVFLGGGTPTYLPPKALADVLRAVHRWLPLRQGGEFSVEATPESVGDETIAVLADQGVNRLSLGAQSFHADLLARLDRVHSADEIAPAVERVRRRIDNVSIDLIFGVPGQSLAQWTSDLDAALRLSPDHVATYGLTYEKGTPLWKSRHRGEVAALPEELELAMYESAMDRLAAAGLEQYEVSNFARVGRRCRHNQTYWANEAYFGFGVGAARYVDGVRELNCRNTQDYIRRVFAGESPTMQSESLPPEESARETAAMQLRRAEGIDRDLFRVQTGFDLDALLGDRARWYVDEGLLADDSTGLRMTRRGRCVADSLAVKVVFG